MRFWWFGLTALLCQAQQASLSPDLDLLTKIKVRVAESLTSLPNYTCAQEIERFRRRATAHRFERLDTVRLEVALVQGKELFGWPGGDRIAESEITNLVRGTIGNGDFALFPRSVFFSDGATFRSRGMVELGGKQAFQFDYQIPLIASGYHLKVPPHEAVVSYHGSFWADADTLDLMRLEIVVDAIPSYLGISATTNRVDFARVTIAGVPFLLPQQAELDIVDLNGWENRNHTAFKSCRQYTGESVLSFTDAEPVPAAPEPDVRSASVNLPDDFDVELELETTIDSDSAAVGDLVKGRLRRDVRNGKSLVLRKGSELLARITRLEHSGENYVMELSSHSITFVGGAADLTTRLNVITMPWALRPARPGTSRGVQNSFVVPLAPIVIPTTHVRLEPGVRLLLRSTKLPAPDVH